jgi:hypothetical protein
MHAIAVGYIAICVNADANADADAANACFFTASGGCIPDAHANADAASGGCIADANAANACFYTASGFDACRRRTAAPATTGCNFDSRTRK